MLRTRRVQNWSLTTDFIDFKLFFIDSKFVFCHFWVLNVRERAFGRLRDKAYSYFVPNWEAGTRLLHVIVECVPRCA